MKLFMGNFFVVASIAFIVVGIVLIVAVSRYSRMRASAIKREQERALGEDAIRLASAKLKFRNVLGKQDQKKNADPLMELYGVETPTDCRPSHIKRNTPD